MVANFRLRYPGEWADLTLAAVLGVVIVSVLAALTWGLCCFWGLIGTIITLLMVAVANSHQKAVSKKVDEDSAPLLHSICREASEKLRMEMPEVYRDDSREVNAFTRGIVSPVVVVHKGLLDVMDRDELAFVLGHEFGHIKLYHFAIRTMFGPAIVRVPLIAYIPLYIFRLLFLNGRMSRSMEYSADRAGLLACGDLEAAVSCMIKLGTGERHVGRDLVSRAVEGKLEIEEDGSYLAQLLSTHPDLDDRIRELVRYSGEIPAG